MSAASFYNVPTAHLQAQREVGYLGKAKVRAPGTQRLVGKQWKLPAPSPLQVGKRWAARCGRIGAALGRSSHRLSGGCHHINFDLYTSAQSGLSTSVHAAKAINRLFITFLPLEYIVVV